MLKPFCVEDIKPPPDFLRFPVNKHHLREFGLCVNIVLDLRVVGEIVWPFGGKTISYPQLCPKEHSFCWKCRRFPFCYRESSFSHFGQICPSKAFNSSDKLLFTVLLESKHFPGGAKSVFSGGNVTKGRLWRTEQPKIRKSDGKR